MIINHLKNYFVNISFINNVLINGLKEKMHVQSVVIKWELNEIKYYHTLLKAIFYIFI